MFTVKSEPITSVDGKLGDNIEIKAGVLLISGNKEKLRYEMKRWYTLGEDGKWYYLGEGACPEYTIENDANFNQALFNNIFEEVK